jgi:glycosyltransferase involved in cell wall biosynthesis
MGATKQKPYSGVFVRNQYDELKKLNDIDVDYFEMPDIKLPRILKLLMRYPSFALLFAKQYIFSRKTYDILHVHFFFPTILVAILYKKFRNHNCKIVVTFHGSDIYYYSPFSYFYRFCTKFIDAAIFVSPKLQNRMQLGISQQVLSAGILDVFQPPSLPVKKKYDFIFVGNLDANKGADRLITLFEKLKTPCTVCIVGVGEYEDKFRSIDTIHQLDILGAQTPMVLKGLYQQSKYLVNLSKNESFGLVMTEAMACGIPIICTNTDGSLEQINHQINGFIVDQKDNLFPENLLTTVKDALCLDHQQYIKMSKFAVDASKANLLSNITRSLTKIYSNLLK